MKKVVSVLLSIMLVLTMCAGCQEKAAEPSGTDAAAPDATVQETQKPAEAPEASDSAASGELKDFTIGYAGLDESQEHLIPVGDNIEKIAKEKGEELGITIKVIRVDNAGDGAKAVENVDNLILQGIDVLVEFNLDAAVNDTIYEKCQNAGIPVMAIDIPVGDAPYMGANNVLAGQLCGEALGDLVNENWEGKVDAVLFEHTPEAGEVVQTRMDSILDGLANKTDYSVDDLKAITTTVSMKDDAILAQQLCADFLTANPDKTHIVIGSINDIGAQGAFAAVQAAGREDDVFIVNHGVSVSTRENIYTQENAGKPNCWRGGVSYFLERYGEYIVPGCIELVQGKTPAPESLLMDHLYIDMNNIEEWYPQAEWAQ
ncbi:sugar ABC transporter substrate-binding protein [Diplocloster agilis]|uniref:Sugar ABC transporter substrate-binding protein n=1 Tax=Diplocloster agilis TaxID=2850323 RepID=A0A949NGA4_9FIRM|nr:MULTISPECIES: sugar ABC transporter substrate-binding protein [Lachnospiraceae]MBU9739411.1 sugar ABC transporter substrate-binding protein [Diplocloster agilis]MBU9747065.1 sugar ABC transporter substrate-binding protein [Diplocloster agilis]MCU6733728.1 sugar ABC transporter substrate-binding protein [Suonthocola fibrivorans]SCJ05270.1 ABC-type sugar transport system%2C periplasmic component [uncultured Clostridium sp.]